MEHIENPENIYSHILPRLIDHLMIKVGPPDVPTNAVPTFLVSRKI